MSKNIPNAKMNERRHIQAATTLFTAIAFLLGTTRMARKTMPSKGRLELLVVAQAEARVRTARWGA